jgi:ABC-type polar amino acid transport system ATPase subunit
LSRERDDTAPGVLAARQAGNAQRPVDRGAVILGVAYPAVDHGADGAHRGTVRYNGVDITGRPAFQVTNLGVAFVPEERRIFPDLTVRQNLEVARKAPASARAREWTIDAVFKTFPALTDLAGRKGGFLSGGEQQMLAMGRTLMGNPDFLLLDEPSEGLASALIRIDPSMLNETDPPTKSKMSQSDYTGSCSELMLDSRW